MSTPRSPLRPALREPLFRPDDWPWLLDGILTEDNKQISTEDDLDIDVEGD